MRDVTGLPHLASQPSTGTDASAPAGDRDLAGDNARLRRTVAELTSFAAVASHDLKSPLASMTGYLQLLANLDPVARESAEYDECLAGLARGIETMRALIDSLFTYATAPDAPLRSIPVDLDRMVREIVAARGAFGGRGAQPRPVITVDPLPEVSGDPTMLRRVIENLLDNAVKYTRPGEAATVHISATVDAHGHTRIDVADQGIGIPEGQHEAVFQHFHRAHREAGYPGAGLGLAICSRIIERHGGRMGARPNRGQGTRVWFTLPA